MSTTALGTSKVGDAAQTVALAKGHERDGCKLRGDGGGAPSLRVVLH